MKSRLLDKSTLFKNEIFFKSQNRPSKDKSDWNKTLDEPLIRESITTHNKKQKKLEK